MRAHQDKPWASCKSCIRMPQTVQLMRNACVLMHHPLTLPHPTVITCVMPRRRDADPVRADAAPPGRHARLAAQPEEVRRHRQGAPVLRSSNFAGPVVTF